MHCVIFSVDPFRLWLILHASARLSFNLGCPVSRVHARTVSTHETNNNLSWAPLRLVKSAFAIGHMYEFMHWVCTSSAFPEEPIACVGI